MKKNKNFLISAFIFFAIGVAHANPAKSLKICMDSPDESGCLLNTAKVRSLKITDLNKRSDSIGSVLKTNAELNRSDFELISKSIQILNDKKLDLEHYLDLQIALATYFVKRDQKKVNLHVDQALKIFYKAVERDEPKERVILSMWACSLIYENQSIWKITSHVTAEYCTPKYTKSDKSNDAFDYESVYMTMLAAWVQSDFIVLESNKKILDNKIAAIEEYGIKNNKKSLNIDTQKFKVYSYALQTNMYWRSSLAQQSMQALVLAKETLIGLEKLTNSVESLESRLAIANSLIMMYEHEESIAFLKPATEIMNDSKRIKNVPLDIQIDYLTTLAEALDRSGFRTYNEIKLSNKEFRKRQADVLYEKYLMLKYLDDKNGVQSKQSFQALIQAAEAGHALAMHNLGVEYAHGNSSTPVDLDKAAYWYSSSAVLGFAGAQNNLGDMYEGRSEADSDMGLSVYWYTQAAMQGEPTAYLSLGDIFFNGKGVPKNYVTASIWLSLAQKHLPDGVNKNKATSLLNKAFASLDEKMQKYVRNRVFNFVPLKQTENKLSDKPMSSEMY